MKRPTLKPISLPRVKKKSTLKPESQKDSNLHFCCIFISDDLNPECLFAHINVRRKIQNGNKYVKRQQEMLGEISDNILLVKEFIQQILCYSGALNTGLGIEAIVVNKTE